MSVWLSWVLGGFSILLGIALVITALTAWGPISEGLSAVSGGLRDAEEAIDLMGSDVSSSSSLISKVSSSIRSTGEVVRETTTTLNNIMETTGEISNLTNEVRLSIEDLPVGIRSMMGQDHFSEITVSLGRTHSASGEAIIQMQHLSETLGPVEALLADVADGVDSLAGDLFSTETAFSDAAGHLESAAAAMESAAGSSFLPAMIAFMGAIPLLVGVFLIIQGLALRKLYGDALPMRETSE
jgi:methyl-accepting chemotaxis protein